MKLKTDENLPEDAAAALRAEGHDVATVRDQGLGGADDGRVRAVCMSEGRALVTLDTDFASILRYPPRGGPGVVVLRLPRQDRATVLDAIRRVAPVLREEDLHEKLWIVDTNRIRVRG